MMSVLLLGFQPASRNALGPGEAVRALAALVPATVDGIVRDLCLAGPEHTGLAQVADHAGCWFAQAETVRDAIEAGARLLKSPQVLVAHAGTIFDRAVMDEIEQVLPLLGEPRASACVVKAAERGLVARLVPALTPVAGLICYRDWLQTRRADSLAELAGQAKGRRTLRATAATRA